MNLLNLCVLALQSSTFVYNTVYCVYVGLQNCMFCMFFYKTMYFLSIYVYNTSFCVCSMYIIVDVTSHECTYVRLFNLGVLQKHN